MSLDSRGEQTRQKILKTGLKMWLENPASVSANGIAQRIQMTHATVLYHFPHGVKDAVAAHALEVGNGRVIAQLITAGHPLVENMAPTDRIRYLSEC